MTGWLLGAVLGLAVAFGALLALRSAPPMRAVRIGDRIAPYLQEHVVPWLLATGTTVGSTASAGSDLPGGGPPG